MNRTFLAAFFSCTALAQGLAPAFADEQCRDSALVQPFPGSKIRDCRDAEFDRVKIATSMDASKEPVFRQLEGTVQWLQYDVGAGRSQLQVTRNFENAFRKAGAKLLVSGAGDPSLVVALFENQKTYVSIKAGAETYEQTILTVREMKQEAEVDPSALDAESKRSQGCNDGDRYKDSAFVKPFPGGTEIRACKDAEFDQVKLPVGVDANKDLIEKTVEGRVHSLEYNVKAPHHSSFQIARNFENALKKAGAKILVGTADAPARVTALFEAKNTYVSIEVGDGSYQQTIVFVQQMQQEIQVDAGALKEELDRSGRVAVYGINFDTNKATITADSGKVLEQVQKLLADNAGLKLRIEGHTDDVGKPQSNLDLSKKRAAAVKAWLVKQGIADKRLSTEGYGASKPIGDNKTDEGKAKNRRVELVRI